MILNKNRQTIVRKVKSFCTLSFCQPDIFINTKINVENHGAWASSVQTGKTPCHNIFTSCSGHLHLPKAMFDFKKTVGFAWIRYEYLNRIEKISTTLNWQIGGSSYLFSFNLISLGFELLLGVVQPLQLYASEHFPKTS